MEETQNVLTYFKNKKEEEYFILFNTVNEIIPYDTIKKSKLSENKFIQSFDIKEYMFSKKDSDDNLIESSSYLAGYKIL